jgi:DNA-directed RNA polymerase subunit beta
MEFQAAVDSGQVIVAKHDGEVVSVIGDQVVVQEQDGTRRVYHLRKYNRSNQSTCIDQRPVVFKGDVVKTAMCSPTPPAPRAASWRWARMWSSPT